MSLVAALSSRVASSVALLLRAAVQRLGLAPLVLAATAAAALLCSLRARGNANRPPRRRRRAPPSRTAQPRAPNDRKPQWLARVRRVTLGAKCTRAEMCALFVSHQRALEQIESAAPPADHVVADSEKALLKEKSEQPQLPDLPIVVQPSAVPHLKRFAKLFDLYIVVRVDDDDTERHVTDALSAVGVFEPGLLDPRKLLFCDTDTGRVSVARQLEPQLHIDETTSVITALQRFVPFVALVTPVRDSTSSQPLASNVAAFASLASFFT
ncbi:Peroxisome biogenesis protein 22 [Gracilariopsis chorda]|uniref:Peroxisome biogenesis protein 22 n=1 Tax=Gracilariopsis chorda TaxID=448386 RepID=A0A2V3IJR6_9FLOR|nr:Peroxisome biogenesis protein 22 [Gracilariopsis chorda]|eukprot:PXF41370.1 Peroxisome biogenesis protein 22 [Gracilariopsis chorda]